MASTASPHRIVKRRDSPPQVFEAVLSAIWLWQRRSWGYVLAGAFLVYDVIESMSVATDQTFGHISDSTSSLGAVPVFVALAVVGLVPVAFYLHHLRDGSVTGHLRGETG